MWLQKRIGWMRRTFGGLARRRLQESRYLTVTQPPYRNLTRGPCMRLDAAAVGATLAAGVWLTSSSTTRRR
jgi:hypothetical protein